MNFGRFQRIATVRNHFTCESCPIVIRKGVILHDRSRNLRLLSLIVTNRGNVTVDEIEVKVISYDRYDNPIPEENGQVGQICRFTDSGCLPDQSIGEGEVILLPSTEVVSCDIMVTRVKTAGNVELIFTDDDYDLALPEVVEKGAAQERNRRLFIGLMIALGVTALLYLLLVISGWYIENKAIPERNESMVQSYLDSKQYDAALRQLRRMDQPDRVETVVLEALEFYMEAGNYERALDYAKQSRDTRKHYDTLCRIVEGLEEGADFEKALDFASSQNNKKLKEKVYTDAIVYFSDKGDFRTALSWVALSGNAQLGDSVWRAAVTHYVGQGDPVTALEYALKTEDEALIKTVYADAVQSLMEGGDYNRAALMMARCSSIRDDRVTATMTETALNMADKSYLRLHIATLRPILGFSRLQKLYARTVAIDEEVLIVGADGKADCTGKFGWGSNRVVSVDIGPDHAVALLSDGTVLSDGDNTYRQCDTTLWTDVIGLGCGDFHTVAVRRDGTVLATGSNEYGQCDVGAWTDIVQVVCGPLFTVGLRSDGTVVAAGRNNAGQTDVSDWKNIILLSAGENHTLGLQYGVTVVAAGVSMSAKCAVSDWQGVVDIAAGSNHSVGLTDKGTVLLAGGSLVGVASVPVTDGIALAAGEENLLVQRPSGLTCLGSGKVSVSSLAQAARP